MTCLLKLSGASAVRQVTVVLVAATLIVVGLPLGPLSSVSAVRTGAPIDSTGHANPRDNVLADRTAAADPTLVGAGDIASCSSSGDEATARLLDGISGTVFTTGDNAYSSGTAAEFADCYAPSWGRHKARTRHSVGNHEYSTGNASGYYGYFGKAAGDPAKGYYSYDLGAWHIVAINSNCGSVGGCQAGSSQERWLRADLAAHPTACTLAYWHHPRFSSGEHGSSTSMQPMWQALHDYRADVVLAGHDHDYERFAPQDAAGKPDPAYGIREFVVGTGGKSHYTISAPIANSQVHNDDTFGVLKVTLHSTSYSWKFVPEAGKTFTDSGSATCHRSPLPVAKAPVQSFFVNSQLAGNSSPVRLAWSATGNVITRYQLQQSTDYGAYTSLTLPSAATASTTRWLRLGHNYRFRVRAMDRAGNWSGWAYGPRFTTSTYQESSGAISYSGAWRRVSLSGASGGYVKYCAVAGSTAKFAFTGRNVAWVAHKSASRGSARVYVDGGYVTTVSLRSAATYTRRVVFTRGWASSGFHTLQVRVVGTEGHPRVDIDAFAVLR